MLPIMEITGSLNMIGYGLATIGPGIGVAMVFAAVINGTARQPEARGALICCSVRDILVGLGLDEIISYSLIDPDDEGRLIPSGARFAFPGEAVRLHNPLAPERSQMRRTLLPGALRTARAFPARQAPNNRILTINAWNEWTEGSYLEPDTVHGMRYLEAIRKVFGPKREQGSEQHAP